MSQHQFDGTFHPLARYLHSPLLLLPPLPLFSLCCPKHSRRWRHLSSLHSKELSSAISVCSLDGVWLTILILWGLFFFNEVFFLTVAVFLDSIILYLLPAEAILGSWSREVANTVKKHALKYYCAEAYLPDHLFHFIALLVWVCMSLRLFLSLMVCTFTWYIKRAILVKTRGLVPESCLLAAARRRRRGIATCFVWDSRHQQTTSRFRVYPLL